MELIKLLESKSNELKRKVEFYIGRGDYDEAYKVYMEALATLKDFKSELFNFNSDNLEFLEAACELLGNFNDYCLSLLKDLAKIEIKKAGIEIRKAINEANNKLYSKYLDKLEQLKKVVDDKNRSFKLFGITCIYEGDKLVAYELNEISPYIFARLQSEYKELKIDNNMFRGLTVYKDVDGRPVLASKLF